MEVDEEVQRRNRSRSNSVEKVMNLSQELDEVYSCDEDNDEEELFTQNLISLPQTKSKKVKYEISKLKECSKKAYQHEVDTNILNFKFDFLSKQVAYATGDPYKCLKCEAILNKFSSLIKMEDSNKSIWVCEFCGENNEIVIEQEEVPQEDCTDYFLQSANQLNQNSKDYNYSDEQALIFCFDISGSMCVSSPIAGKHKLKGNNLEKNMKDLLSFSDGSQQHFGNQGNNITYISRLQCLQAAIENNLGVLLKACPNRKVGFVVFNNEVICYGDGTKTPTKINGNNLDDYAVVKEIALQSQDNLTKPLKDTYQNLLTQLYSLEESGQTALGPGILFSINLINEVSPGSKIILCTDGIANKGFGSMEGKDSIEEQEELKNFYVLLGVAAKEKGIVINLITFEDEESKIEILSGMIEQTGGEIIRVKPTEILNEFSNLLTNEVIATNVKIKVKLHKVLQFRNEEADDIKDDGTTLCKDIGNATTNSELFVEYNFKKSDEIAKYEDIEIDKLEKVPFQSIIDYTNKQGDRCIRVLTKYQIISSEKEHVENQAAFDIISTNAIQKTSKMAKEGNYRGAQSNALAWKKMIKKNVSSNEGARANYSIFNNNMNDFNNDIQEIQYSELVNSQPMIEGLTNNQTRSHARKDKISTKIHQLKSISNISSQNMYNNNKSKKK